MFLIYTKKNPPPKYITLNTSIGKHNYTNSDENCVSWNSFLLNKKLQSSIETCSTYHLYSKCITDYAGAQSKTKIFDRKSVALGRVQLIKLSKLINVLQQFSNTFRKSSFSLLLTEYDKK